MQLVRAHFVFRLLGDLAVLIGRQQFGRDRGLDHIHQDRAQRFAVQVLCRIAHKVLNEGLGDTGVDAVHGHLVAVVSTPAECEFAQVTRTDHDSVQFIGEVHQDERTHAGLRVLIGRIVDIHVMTDIVQVLGRYIADGYLTVGDAQLLHELERVLVRTVRSAETGHGHAHYAATVVA